jgi:hypothetical protein
LKHRNEEIEHIAGVWPKVNGRTTSKSRVMDS